MKKEKIILCVSAAALMVIMPALAAVNMFAASFPEWVMLVPAVLLASVCVLFAVRTDAGRRAKIILPVISALIIAAGWLGSYCNPYWSSVSMRYAENTPDYDTVITYRQAEADMEQMRARLLKCHPMFIDGCPDVFSRAYEEALCSLKGDSEITVNDLNREMQRALSVLSDGHTNVYAVYGDQRYLKTIAGRRAEGWRFSAVNGKTPAQLFEERRDLFCYEADSWGVHQLESMLSTLSGLDYLGIDPEGVQFTWISGTGESVTDVHTAADFLAFAEYVEYNSMYRTGEEQTQSFVRYSIDSENDLAVLTLSECVFSEEYKACFREMFTEIKNQGIGSVAVDLRGNGGGNSLVANEFIRYLDVDSYKSDGYEHRLGVFVLDYTDDAVIENDRYSDLTFSGDVYVLTDTGSFSSSMLFAMYIKDNDLGTVIGDPPGNDPNGYGDIAVFRMDNSGLFMSVSTKKFVRADRECTDSLVMPDIACDGEKALDVLIETLGTDN